MSHTDPLFSLAGKTALVTGGTNGIGAMIARGLVRRGVKTYISGRDAARTTAFAEALSAEGGTCIGLAAELSAEDGPAALAAQLSATETRLDLLVNNAGANGPGSLAAMSMADWDMVMNVNVRAAFFLINLGSIGGLHIPNWEAHAYNTSKAAIHHLTRSLCKALGPDRITVNAIAPGPFPSRLTDTDSDAVKKSVATYIPLGRPGSAQDVEGLVVFLASRAGAYVNGATIPLDGGYVAAL